ncbi:MAG: chromosomal replication initiator protein DnaA [Gemmatimonadetes bacterium]|nr:chromosomal replication initiator protein DnaA [Gemmatimonadota bacterium]MDE2677158.1 chromosomal replication initiator protein DnaA [Gemmatimonadota bacterium]MYA12568.1 chromosomal replication initiator protein DnaA [Gemmatimonadota bacterium]MYE71164.1 chromosomal replication initiator protein DnaA [Gemmatimonadota bacterium]MYJ68684.1 chromosomal replication initiator protein DnaA [Gemmatimonadota bacterium]
MEERAHDLWEQILEQARRGLPEQTYATWVSSARFVSWDGGALHIVAPSRFHAEWLEDKYGQTLQEIGGRILGTPVRLRVSSAEASQERAAPEVTVTPIVEPPEPTPVPLPAPADLGLNSRYTFERFIVGQNNQLAQAASQSVAERPAQGYNPLFLYGATGLGKTHLMHAIAHHILHTGEAVRICYIPAEQFVNEMVAAIYGNTTAAFRARYRSYDLLLVDDVQFLRRKEHTQEEFFHTFNVLHNGGRQIVLTSDRHPKELDGLEERLVSRFEWGLVAAVHPPDYETRLAILKKKADEDSVELDPEVLDLIARVCKSSVRELEGAIIKLLAFSSLTRRELTVELARQALLGGAESLYQPLDAGRIREVVAEEWGVSSDSLASVRRSRDVLVPRQVAMFLMRTLLDIPLARIGREFGGRDHSTVHHSIRKVDGRLSSDEDFRQRVTDLRQRLENCA